MISYGDQTNGHLKVLHCGNRACAAGNTSTAVADSLASSLAIGRDGLPLIAYAKSELERLEVVHCSNRACTAGNTTSTFGNLSGNFVLTIGRDGLPLISYHGDASNPSGSAGVELLHCGNRSCTSGNATTNVVSGYGIGNAAIAIGTTGDPSSATTSEANSRRCTAAIAPAAPATAVMSSTDALTLRGGLLRRSRSEQTGYRSSVTSWRRRRWAAGSTSSRCSTAAAVLGVRKAGTTGAARAGCGSGRAQPRRSSTF